MALNDLWIAGTDPDQIYRRVNGVWEAGIAGPSGQTIVTGIAFDAAGDLWICGGEPDQIYRRVNGVWEAGIAGPSGQTIIAGIAFDAAGDLWIAGSVPDQIYRRVNGVWEAGIAGPSGQTIIAGIAFDAAGDLWIAGGEPDQIYRRVNGVWEAGIAGPSGQTAITDIAFDAAGDLWIAGSVPDQIYRRVNGVWEAGIAGPPGQIAITGIAFALTGSAPAFADNTGDAISGTVGTAIANVVVPEASGTPAPTYAVVGSLPAGVSFDTDDPPDNAAGVLEFDEDDIEVGSGTITIRATNSEGTADWTVDYSFVAAEVVADPGTTAAGTPEAELSAGVRTSLTLADIEIPSGRVLVGTGSLIQVGASGDVFNLTDATVVAGEDPPDVGTEAPTRIYVTANPQLRISTGGGGDIEDEWTSGGAYENHQIHVQTSLTNVVSDGSEDVDPQRSTSARLLLGTNADPQGLLDDVAALANGDRVLWFLSEPEVSETPVDANPGTVEAGAPDAALTATPTLDPVSADLGTSAAGAPEAEASATPTLDPVLADPGAIEAGAPQAALTATVVSATSVAVDPGAVAAGNPEAALTATVLLGDITLADIAIPSGRVLVGEASLITVGASGDIYNTSDATVSDGADPPNLGAANLNATRIYVTPNPQLRISEDGAGNIETIFSAGGAQEDYQFHIQTSPTDVLSYGSGDIHSGRSTGARLLVGADGDPDGLLDDIAAIANGDRVIWFLSEPQSGDHVTVDPGTTAGGDPETGLSATPRTDPGSNVFDLGSEFDDTPWEGAVLVAPRYIENGATAYLRRIGQNLAPASRFVCPLHRTVIRRWRGPEFTTAVKEYVSAFTFTDGADASVVLPGPDNDTNSFF